jgi:hypothetical protein
MNIIKQDPLYNLIPVGQSVIFTIKNTSIVQNYFNVKFIAEVYISHTTPPNMSSAIDLVGTFKTTPNGQGVGIFDFGAVVENYVKSDNVPPLSLYKTNFSTIAPIHMIDWFIYNENALAWLSVEFKIEGSLTATGAPYVIATETKPTYYYEIFNGYLKQTDKLNTFQDSFGYDITRFQPAVAPLGKANSKRFLTNAPLIQYANIEDYGTIALFNQSAKVDYIRFDLYDSSDVFISTIKIHTGIGSNTISQSKYRLLYVGVFPANLRNWSSDFTDAFSLDLSYYTMTLYNKSDEKMTKTYTININCYSTVHVAEQAIPSTIKIKGYEPVRLTWLNQWGVWDYYTFTLKSSRTISTKGSTYTQLEGTWNERAFKLNGYRGGKKTFRVNATEKIKMNTDFVNESESEWFEELINSPEVYILEGFQSDSNFAMLNTYVTPVRLTTSSYTRKTVANDRLMQYTFEVEKSKTLRTQSI